MKTTLIILVSVIMFASCSSQGAKVKILSSGNVVIVQNKKFDNLAVGDTVMIEICNGVFNLSDSYYQRDTSVVNYTTSHFFRAVIVEKLPVSQPPRNGLLLLFFPA